MNRLILILAAVGLLAAPSLGAAYIVKYASVPPSGPADPVWNAANVMPNIVTRVGTITSAADLSWDVRYMWDGTNLYGRAMITDNIHNYPYEDDRGNHYQADVVEFYINAVNTASTTFVTGTTQDTWGISYLGQANHSNYSDFVHSTAAQVVLWTDSNFDPTGTTNTTNGGNYGIQVAWPWTVAGASGGLGLSATPTGGQLMKLSVAIGDSDITNNGAAAQHVSVISSSNSATAYDNPSAYAPAQLIGPNPIVSAASAATSTTVNVVYSVNSSATAMDVSATIPANYTLSGGVTILSASLLADGVTVQLTTSPLALGATYTLTVTGVLDAVGNLIAPNPATTAFVVPLVKLTTQHIAIGGGTNFTLIPNPSAADLAQTATFSSATALDGNSGPFTKLQDGLIEPAVDDPADSAFFGSAASITVDLKAVVPINMINTYSRHENTGEIGGGARAPQVYNLYGSTDNVAYTFIVSVSNTVGGGAWGNSITSWSGGNATFGSYRYLRFDTLQAPAGTTQSWTFYGEIDVFAASANPTVASVTYVNPTTLNVGFVGSTTASTMDPVTAANSANYVLDSGATVSAATLLADGVTVQLTTSVLAPATTYYLTVSNVRDAAANVISPNPSTAPVITAARPKITSATATNLTQVTVIFTKTMDAGTAGNAANYTITGLTVGSATVVNATTVTLGVSTMAANTSYTLTVNNVQDTQVPPVAIAAGSTKGFTTPVAPAVTGVAVADATHVTVTFSKAVSGATATNTANYLIDGGISVSSVASASSTSVTLTVSALTSGSTYTLTVRDVQDTTSPPITLSPNPTTQTFTYSASLVTYLFGATEGFDPTIVNGLDTSVNMTITQGAGMLTFLLRNDLGYASSPVLQVIPNGFTNTATSVTGSAYWTFSVKAPPGQKLNLSRLEFDVARGGGGTRGWCLLTSVGGFASDAAKVQSSDVTTTRPTWSHFSVDLSAAAFQNLTGTITFRMYVYTGGTGSSLEFDSVALYGNVLATGTPPTVAITSPTGTTTAAIGTPVNLSAAVTITNSAATYGNLQFLDNGSPISGSLTGSGGVYTFLWTATPVGTHNITAKATDSVGGVGTSSAVTVNVISSLPPTVAIARPTGTLVGAQGWQIALSATATNGTPGTVTGVEFFLDTYTDMGPGTHTTGTTYTFNWDSTPVIFGAHTLTAKATDSGGLTGSCIAALTVYIRLPGDGNGDDIVDGLDYGIWQNGYQQPGATYLTGDFNGDGIVDGLDYGVWQNNYNRSIGLSDEVVAASSADMAATPMVGGSAPQIVSVTPTSDAIAIVFDRDVVVGAGAVEVSGLGSGPQAFAAVYDVATRTLTLTFGAALPADSFTVRVIGSFVVAADGGAALDGAGSGTPGSDAQVQFSTE